MLLSYSGYYRLYHLPDCRDTFEQFLSLACADMRFLRSNKPFIFAQHVDYLWRIRYCNNYRVEV